MTDTAPLLELDGLTVSVPGRDGHMAAVDGVNLSLRPGEALGLVGESGSGKSLTCLSVLRGLPPGARIASGAIRFQGRDLTTLSEREMRGIRGRGAAMILQDPLTSLNPVYTIGDQLREGLRISGRAEAGRRAVDAQVVEALREVWIPSPESRLGAYPHQFSGGMRQRCVAAMALSASPALLIADEPTTALDVSVQDQFLRLLVQLQESHHMALLMVSHDLGVIANTCDRVAVMYAGRIVETGTVDAVFGTPRHPYTQGLLHSLTSPGSGAGRARALYQIPGEPPDAAQQLPGCRFAPRCAHAMPVCSESYPEMRHWPDGVASACWLEAPPRDIAAHAARSGATEPEAQAAPLLTLDRVEKSFPVGGGPIPALFGRTQQLQAVSGVSLEVPAGATLGIVGESGSGKTTLARLILALDTPTAGRIAFEGRDVHGERSQSALHWYRRQVQAVLQDVDGSLDPRMSVEEIVTEPLRFAGREAYPNSSARALRAAEMLDAVGLPARFAGRHPHELSGGQKQRVAIARAMSTGPRLVVLDEPVSALDVSIRNQILNLLGRLQAETGVTYVMIAHDLSLVAAVADHVAVMYLGEIVESGPAARVLGDPLHPYTQGLKAATPRVTDRKTLRPSALTGEIPSPLNPPSGCRFHTRCPLATDLCRTKAPVLAEAPDGRRAACHVTNPADAAPVDGAPRTEAV